MALLASVWAGAYAFEVLPRWAQAPSIITMLLGIAVGIAGIGAGFDKVIYKEDEYGNE